MSDNKKMIRFYLGLFLIVALLTYAVDLNSRLHYIVLNSPLISNSFCFSILSGILTGVAVALFAEIKQYCLRRHQARDTLYIVALKLYNLLIIQKAGVVYYIKHPFEVIPKNLCGYQAQQPIYSYILQFGMIDYNTFGKNDNINLALKNFSKRMFFIENTVRNFINISITYNEVEIENVKKHTFTGNVTSESVIMSNALQKEMKELENCLSIIDDFCSVFEKIDNKCYRWSHSKVIASELEKQIEQDVYYSPCGK